MRLQSTAPAPDAMSTAEVVAYLAVPAALLSVFAELVLARRRLPVTPRGDIKVRNPVRKFHIPLDAVNKVQVGMLGIPCLIVGDTKIRIGLEQTLLDSMNSGSESLGVLRYIVASHVRQDRRD